jgi:hypothetical protein
MLEYGWIAASLWFVVCDLWFVVCGLWFVVCGLWFVVCGLWFVGLWFVEEFQNLVPKLICLGSWFRNLLFK